MDTASESFFSAAPIGERIMHLVFRGDELAVREALESTMAALRALGVGEEPRGQVEIVLAEALNNVVEHAFGNHDRGIIEVEAARVPLGFAFVVRDDGRPMPRGQPPAGAVQDLAVEPADLPEGGFGWQLIRSLTDDLGYRRVGDRNELSFRVTLDGAAHAGRGVPQGERPEGMG
jgi:serine/threonine-protein kinase RsbW